MRAFDPVRDGDVEIEIVSPIVVDPKGVRLNGRKELPGTPEGGKGVSRLAGFAEPRHAGVVVSERNPQLATMYAYKGRRSDALSSAGGLLRSGVARRSATGGGGGRRR